MIESRTWSSSGGVTNVRPSNEQKNEEVGASSTRPCGVTSSASSAPSALARRVASMFAPYDSDFTPSRIRVGA